ncbi:Gfo/Idh/MocA family protein [Streptomyces cellostaticus]|uniref:Gfo/Idh/MocA family protein n=1 Tax=Streptomyces cellostaticus TaxID=67285 RepID=UPI002026DEA9|nr:Gfo/Idh/MocA family oxidoreductase [Streptomyces cellostaticus]
MILRPGFRVLVAGCGEIARRVHLPYLTTHPCRPEIVLYDTDPATASRAAKEFGLRVHDGPPSAAGAEAAVICTPPSSHADLAVVLLEAGAHVVCEKPLADTIEGAQRIAGAARRHRREVFPCYTNRFRDDVGVFHELLASGEIGKPQQVSARWRRRSGTPGTQGALSAGVLWDLGSHLVDLALRLTGWSGQATVLATATSAEYEPGAADEGWYGSSAPASAAPVVDTVHGLARFSGGGALSLEVSWHAHDVRDEVLIRVTGTRGVAELRTLFGFSPDRRTVPSPAIRVTTDNDPRWRIVLDQQSREPVEYRRQLDLAFSTPRTDPARRLADLTSAVTSVALCDAFARSLTTGASVTALLPEDTRS